ncbi:MAG: MotA/TolQ/ExbB proton channel family protein [Verrucomicrobia bacterium]|nr:MotA/TolQ/ExbB proton channel family protein [Verrucomicrobiota bacterium]
MKKCLIFSILSFSSTLFAAEPASQLLDLKKVFGASPVIYALLILLSVASLVIWLYSLATFRPKEIMPKTFSDQLKKLLVLEQYDEAQKLCSEDGNILSNIVAAGLTTRRLGPQVMVDAMKSEGKRASTAFWQRLSLLNDIVIVAPMLGLLGTVVGMFYAFYDVNRSIESINALFDGLGIAVGTTVMGLVVAILAMIFYTTLKYRLIKTLTVVENEAVSLSALIEAKRN